MAADQDKVVWFPKDSWLFFLLMLPVWLIGGLGWGFFMHHWDGRPLEHWLGPGLLWGVTCWITFSIWMAFCVREFTVTLAIDSRESAARCLAEAVKNAKYVAEVESQEEMVYRPRLGLARLLQSFRLRVRFRDGVVELSGPAMVVKAVRKKLRAD